MDDSRFQKACEHILKSTPSQNGIGTLSEKTLHAVLKHYFEPDESCHEILSGNYVADIKNEQGIIEIQTRSLERLLKKIPTFIENDSVIIVYPLPCHKTISWIDSETGEITKARHSPKTGTVYDAYRELYKLRPILPQERLMIKLLLIDMDEYRYLDGWSKDKKRGSTRCERIPNHLVGEYDLYNAEDFRLLIPSTLTQPFTVKEFMKAAKVSQRAAGCGISLLRSLGLIEQVGKQGRAYLYQQTKEEPYHE